MTRFAALLLLGWLTNPALQAAPYTPGDDTRVLERLPLRAADPAVSLLESEQQRSAEEWEARLSAAAHSPTDLPLLAECNNNPSGLYAWARIDSADPSHADL